MVRESNRLPIALRMHHPPVPSDPLIQAPSLLMAEEHRCAAVPRADAGDERRIITREAIAVQLDEVGGEPPDAVERVGTDGMACELDDLPDGACRVLGSPAVPGHGYNSRRWASRRRSSDPGTTGSI